MLFVWQKTSFCGSYWVCDFGAATSVTISSLLFPPSIGRRRQVISFGFTFSNASIRRAASMPVQNVEEIKMADEGIFVYSGVETMLFCRIHHFVTDVERMQSTTVEGT
jgi:hypothetical protein